MARTGFAFRLDLMLARAFSILAAGLLLGALAPATALADLSAGTIETYDELVSACQRGGTYTLVEDITYGGAYPRVSAWLTIDLNNAQFRQFVDFASQAHKSGSDSKIA